MGELQQEHELWLEGAVGEMEPVEVVGVVLVGRRKRETAVTVLVDDVLDAGAGFGEGEVVILDDGRLAEGIEVFDGLRGEDGVALVEDESVGDLELFAEPDHAVGLRDLEMVNF